MFRNSFALMGLIFGLFFVGCIAFPDGCSQSVYRGTTNVPSVELIGDWVGLAFALAHIATGVFFIFSVMGIGVCLLKRKNLKDVAEAFGVDVSEVEGMSPMQAYEFLEKKAGKGS